MLFSKSFLFKFIKSVEFQAQIVKQSASALYDFNYDWN
jgi:hypothetical protein